MRPTRALAAITLGGALIATAGAPSGAEGLRSSGASPAARAAALGEIFGPQAATDAYLLLGLTGTSPAGGATPEPRQAAPQAAPGQGAPPPEMGSTDADAAAPAAPGGGAVTAPAAPGGGAVTALTLKARQQLINGPAAPGAAPVPSLPVGAAPQPRAAEPPLSAGNPAAGPLAPAVRPPVGGLVCPVAGPNSFTDTYGAPRPGGRSHAGTDIMAATGVPLVAVAAGVVVAVAPVDRPGSLGGISVSYTTTNGDRWYNAHLSSVAPGVAIGGFLRPGQVFGYVGATGDATGPHLHIERHPGGGAAVNAFTALKAACG